MIRHETILGSISANAENTVHLLSGALIVIVVVLLAFVLKEDEDDAPRA